VRNTWTRSVNLGLLHFDITAVVPTVTMTVHVQLFREHIDNHFYCSYI
jgi:hypothetical protein